MILLIDNVDSFVHNLRRYFAQLGQPSTLVRIDAAADQLARQRPSAIVLSPGPGRPTDDCPTVRWLQQLDPTIPLLGVCLGHQQLAQAWGGTVVRSDNPMHGRDSKIYHDGLSEFATLPNPFSAARYHSLVVRELPHDKFTVSARTEAGTVMAMRGVHRPLFGWQFHPESILTPVGHALLAGFLREIGLPAIDRIRPSDLELMANAATSESDANDVRFDPPRSAKQKTDKPQNWSRPFSSQ